jgi:hypothetical protein
MPHPAHSAAARRDGKLLRIRKLTLWITGGAAAASLGLGTAFAHAVPGHSYTTGSSGTGSTPSAGTAEPQHKTGQRTATRQLATRHHGTEQRAAGRRQATGRATAHPQHQKLAAPTKAPAPAPAPTSAAPVVSSGGS